MSEQVPASLARLRALMRGVTTRNEEREIVAVLRDAPPDALNALLAGVDVDALFGDLDNRLMGPDLRSEAFILLADERRADLTLDNLARVIYAMQTGNTRRHYEALIRDVFVAQDAERTVLLKSLLSAHGNHHDLETLLFEDIDDEAIRQDILDHFAAVAGRIRAPELKILCDIDDTLRCRLHDRRYPKGTIYPGVVQFLIELDGGAADDPRSPGDLTFVTARPQGVVGVVENYTRGGLQGLGLPEHSILSGSLVDLLGHDSMADKKLSNFRNERLLFPECAVVFIGDSGQADIQVGERMIREAGTAVRGVFIHDIRESAPDRRAELRLSRIYPFDTYIGAAREACALGLIADDAVDRVADAAWAGFRDIDFSSDAQRDHIRTLLERDTGDAGA